MTHLCRAYLPRNTARERCACGVPLCKTADRTTAPSRRIAVASERSGDPVSLGDVQRESSGVSPSGALFVRLCSLGSVARAVRGNYSSRDSLLFCEIRRFSSLDSTAISGSRNPALMHAAEAPPEGPGVKAHPEEIAAPEHSRTPNARWAYHQDPGRTRISSLIENVTSAIVSSLRLR
jgi:hypothetical protein